MNGLSKVTFINQPKLSENDFNQDQNKRRMSLIPIIEDYLNTNELFDSGPISVNFFHTGVSGLTSLIETKQNKYVLKILIRPDGPKGEALFLKAWERVGISVPHVYESGMLSEHPYILMTYVPALTLEYFSEKELMGKEVFKQMGEMLQVMHTTQGKGVGRIIQGDVGEYQDFKTWLLEYPQTINQLAYIQKNNLLPKETFGSIERAKDILIEHIVSNPRSTYCHWDFVPGNVLNTKPLTVFDPVPIFNHPYLDIARSIVQTIGAGYINPEVNKQFLDGYFSGNSEPLNQRILQAAVLFISHTKIPYWHKSNEQKIFADLKNYLIENKSLLV